MNNVECLIDSSHGVYVPQAFIRAHAPADWGIEAGHVKTLLVGPDHPDYWETWDDVRLYARYTAEDGRTFTLHEDGDLYAVAIDAMTDSERCEFFGEDR